LATPCSSLRWADNAAVLESALGHGGLGVQSDSDCKLLGEGLEGEGVIRGTSSSTTAPRQRFHRQVWTPPSSVISMSGQLSRFDTTPTTNTSCWTRRSSRPRCKPTRTQLPNCATVAMPRASLPPTPSWQSAINPPSRTEAPGRARRATHQSTTSRPNEPTTGPSAWRSRCNATGRREHNYVRTTGEQRSDDCNNQGMRPGTGLIDPGVRVLAGPGSRPSSARGRHKGPCAPATSGRPDPLVPGCRGPRRPEGRPDRL